MTEQPDWHWAKVDCPCYPCRTFVIEAIKRRQVEENADPEAPTDEVK